MSSVDAAASVGNYEKVRALVESVDNFSPALQARCALALSVAYKLDEAVADSSSTSAMAVPQLSKELRAAIEEIDASQGVQEEFIASIFSS